MDASLLDGFSQSIRDKPRYSFLSYNHTQHLDVSPYGRQTTDRGDFGALAAVWVITESHPSRTIGPFVAAASGTSAWLDRPCRQHGIAGMPPQTAKSDDGASPFCTEAPAHFIGDNARRLSEYRYPLFDCRARQSDVIGQSQHQSIKAI